MKPTILCFKPDNNKSFSKCGDAFRLLIGLPDDIECMIDSCYNDVRNVPKALRKITK